jgi:hypothetical protein
MYLVHRSKDRVGRWEIAWMWLPYFLGIDRELHKFVGQKMTEEFKGVTHAEDNPPDELLQRMHDRVIDLIVEKRPIAGLREYLYATQHITPEGVDGAGLQQDAAAG